MNTTEIRASVVHALQRIAPEADLSAVPGDADLRDALDIDSMDFLRFVVTLHDELHVDVPERDYGQVRTLDGCIAYLAKRTSEQPPPAP